MYQSIIDLKTKFEKITNKGWIEGVSPGKGNVGNTFEKELGLSINNFEIPDFNGIEIKTTRNSTLYKKSYISLFSATFDGKYLFEIKRLTKKYGKPDETIKTSNVLYMQLYGKYLTPFGDNFKAKLDVNYKEKKVFLLVFDHNGKLIDDNSYWSFELLEEKLLRKLQYLAVINADNKFLNNKEYFYYKSLNIYTLKNFECFLKLIENGYIKVSICVGVYKSGKKIGKMYDHGTKFQIKQSNIEKLFYKL